jgi:hypothetical protein
LTSATSKITARPHLEQRTSSSKCMRTAELILVLSFNELFTRNCKHSLDSLFISYRKVPPGLGEGRGGVSFLGEMIAMSRSNLGDSYHDLDYVRCKVLFVGNTLQSTGTFLLRIVLSSMGDAVVVVRPETVQASSLFSWPLPLVSRFCPMVALFHRLAAYG